MPIRQWGSKNHYAETSRPTLKIPGCKNWFITFNNIIKLPLIFQNAKIDWNKWFYNFGITKLLLANSTIGNPIIMVLRLQDLPLGFQDAKINWKLWFKNIGIIKKLLANSTMEYPKIMVLRLQDLPLRFQDAKIDL